ncbi:MAG: protein translocase subunit SecDF [Chitinophagaceae bacterium]|jgi:SecD/SecF fusion protein|nr:protein translocase subunit SecDF [Chitinophagaceae bacterium]
MQLKGLVRFFTIVLIIICLYQLSFTWIVRNYESGVNDKVTAWIKAHYPTPQQKYPGNKDQMNIYADSLETLQKQRVQHILDSTKDTNIGPFGLVTYQGAKDNELALGLDLQGGMSVTMEVGMDGLISSLANHSTDPAFKKALATAVQTKANSGADLITIFGEEYAKATSNNGKLAPLFVSRSNGKITVQSSNDQVLSYLRQQSGDAFENTSKILRTRIDRFGVSSPTINPDKNKGIITIELAGVKDPERVRRYLQSTANLQFFEVYNINELSGAYVAAEKALSDYLKGGKTDTAQAAKDTSTSKILVAQKHEATDTNKVVSLSELDSNHQASSGVATTGGKTDSTAYYRTTYPLRTILNPAQPYQGEDGKVQIPAAIGYVKISDTALLNSYLALDFVKNKFPSNAVFMYGKPEPAKNGKKASDILALYAIRTLDNGLAPLEGDNVESASADYDDKGRNAIKMNMNTMGTRIWAKLTEKNVGKPIAIVLDNIVYSAPNVTNIIPNGSSEITGSFTTTEAQDLASILQSGKLPAPAKIVQTMEVGPTLGNEAVKGGALSFGIAFVVIFILMLVYFNTAGWIANIALILNLLFTVGVLASINTKLTAPGIAGLVLTIGMAVDTNVIIFERIKEELTKGKSYQVAVADGYKRSYAPVLDAHVTTLLTAIILFSFGIGPILGFATTQIIGILLSLFCGILVSRLISDMYTTKDRHFVYFTNLSKKIFNHKPFPFVKYRKAAYVISAIVVVLGIAAIFNGFDKGVEFSGGRSYTVHFEKAPSHDAVLNDLKTEFGEFPLVKTVNTPTQLNITTSYRIHDLEQSVDMQVQEKLYDGLKKYLPEGTSFKDFSTKNILSSQTVLPTISDELEKGALKATIIAIFVICLYIFIRFRDWRYSMGTIVSLIHDVFVTLIVFSFFKKIVPFPLEIDQHFIAAVLTVIGFSMNDTIIVYDRIREDAKLMFTNDKKQIINKAINDTLSRTIMTSLTVFLTILILFIFGGEVTRGFSFAMLIGVITGTYSSIFVAAPILIDIAKNKPLHK